MSRVIRLAAVSLITALICISTGCTSLSPVRAEQQVRSLEREWLDAYEKRDPVAMDRILADGFTITYPNAAVQTKQDVVDYITRERAAQNAAPHFLTESTVARVYPRTVILTGLVITERTRNGETTRSVQRYTDTYVLSDGRWRVAASHLSTKP